MSIDDFRVFCKTHQAILHPIFVIQEKLKEAVMGSAFWETLSKRRIELRGGYNVPLANFMVLVSCAFACMLGIPSGSHARSNYSHFSRTITYRLSYKVCLCIL